MWLNLKHLVHLRKQLMNWWIFWIEYHNFITSGWEEPRYATKLGESSCVISFQMNRQSYKILTSFVAANSLSNFTSATLTGMLNKRNLFAIFSNITHTLCNQNAGKLRNATHINGTFDDFSINYKSASPSKSNIIEIAKRIIFSISSIWMIRQSWWLRDFNSRLAKKLWKSVPPFSGASLSKELIDLVKRVPSVLFLTHTKSLSSSTVLSTLKEENSLEIEYGT